MKLKKEIITMSDGQGILLYGYSNFREAAKDYKEAFNEKLSNEDWSFVKVIKSKKDDEDYYFWANLCSECGRKNDGVKSIFVEIW